MSTTGFLKLYEKHLVWVKSSETRTTGNATGEVMPLKDIEKPKKDTTIVVANVIAISYRNHVTSKTISRDFKFPD
jgi:hypothetical protein